MINWSMPDTPPELALARAQIEMLNPTSKKRPSHAHRYHRYLIKIAQLGGYIAIHRSALAWPQRIVRY
jgi:hypothetical protein